MSDQYGYTEKTLKSEYSSTAVDEIASNQSFEYEYSVDQIGKDLVHEHDFSKSFSSLGGMSSAISQIEQAILRSQNPIEIQESEEITVNGHRGVWANKSESVNWRGSVPISQYSVNEDPAPDVITKRSQQQLIYQQEVAIRYLRPPTPPSPGEIIVQQESNTVTSPAPPLIIRQQPPRPVTPQPLVVREAPPQPPAQVGRKIITISGRKIPPPPRKVVIERLAPLPSKPQSVIIERWLPYSQVKRRVIFQKSKDAEPSLVKPKNVIIQWESPQVQVKKEFKDLGVIRANPLEYVSRYGQSLKMARDLPSFVLEIQPPKGVVLASEYQQSSQFELVGDLHALKLVDLEREGLGEYKELVRRLEVTTSTTNYEQRNVDFIAELFGLIDLDNNGKVSVDEAEKILLKLNSRLGRHYGSDDVDNFFSKLDTNNDGFVDMEEFRVAFQRSL